MGSVGFVNSRCNFRLIFSAVKPLSLSLSQLNYHTLANNFFFSSPFRKFLTLSSYFLEKNLEKQKI